MSTLMGNWADVHRGSVVKLHRRQGDSYSASPQYVCTAKEDDPCEKLLKTMTLKLVVSTGDQSATSTVTLNYHKGCTCVE